jgi:hypothetical protein
MNKTIEELASEYYLNEVINGDTCDDKDGWTDCFVSGANHLMQLPLADRLTDDEKERVRKLHGASIVANRMFGKDDRAFDALERIFGDDFFKEGE